MPAELLGHGQDDAAEALGGADGVADDVAVLKAGGGPHVEGELLDVVLVGEVAVERRQRVRQGPQPESRGHLDDEGGVGELAVDGSLRRVSVGAQERLRDQSCRRTPRDEGRRAAQLLGEALEQLVVQRHAAVLEHRN